MTPSDLRSGDTIRFTGRATDGTFRRYRASVHVDSFAPGKLSLAVWRGHRRCPFLHPAFDGRITDIEILKRKAA